MKPKGKLVVSLPYCIYSKIICLSHFLIVRKVFGLDLHLKRLMTHAHSFRHRMHGTKSKEISFFCKPSDSAFLFYYTTFGTVFQPVVIMRSQRRRRGRT